MTADAIIRARIDSTTKQKAIAALDAMGLSVSDAIRLLMLRIAEEKRLPFELKVPEVELAPAIERNTRRRDTGEDLFRDLEH
ncbi:MULTISPECIES: type II toxin-antitoxin system RelB/DinJ family antitoxin [unclassified Rhizobium]|uniref:type II toxin-antitoxin system RelB/DinJ family antitoxin n=1 Tax=unclassified Rhizobium TaxID=2613769 RepID=UPI0007131ED1|nr:MULTISPECIES: type II toxin-antitoxin system RelB/DinJ family antitoxin [unclassified Rhizobium]KQS87603.1 translation repressor RelB [Rhizobium sp. Leaf391]KQT07039.1 translation repressor RelB [Rhizobium sp. Leaf386]KQT95165.1 translation repressor RelB [Rhizobium sp. Leaf453]